MRNLYLTFEPGQWWPAPDHDIAPGELEVQIVRHTLRVGSAPERAACDAFRYLPGEPGPELVRVEVLAELLPEDARP